jgi:L-amino acid N-acyltransferase YncA
MPFTNFNLRYATSRDAEAVLEIYKPYILNSAISFEYAVPSPEEYTQRVQGILSVYPFFVCELDDKVVGYAYATKFRDRAAYNWDIETSVYISDEFQKQGIATLLYNRLLEECTNRGYHNAFAGITIPNDKSVNFHAKQGFTKIGVFKNAGFKQGAWHSVLFMEKNLIPCDRIPKEIMKRVS